MASDTLILTAIRAEARAILHAAPQLAVQVVGIGAVRLRDAHGINAARQIVVAGLAGALDPALQVGDVATDLPLAGHACPTLRRGKIVSLSRLAATPQEKARLFAQTRAAVVEMEQAVIAAAAPEAQVFGVRAVSDRADEALDPQLLGLIDEVGRPRPLALTRLLLRRPMAVSDLLRLSRASRLALRNLGNAIAALHDAGALG